MTRTVVALSFSLVGCLGVPGPQSNSCPDEATFKNEVMPVIETRCGSLDCHGNIARPLRVYGQTGLRLIDLTDSTDSNKNQISDALEQLIFGSDIAEKTKNYPGLDAKETTDKEKKQTRRSICGLQPEQMTPVLQGELDPDKLLLFSKPLLLERHKGGKVMAKGSRDYDCIKSWLLAQPPEINKAACAAARKDL